MLREEKGGERAQKGGMFKVIVRECKMSTESKKKEKRERAM